MKYAISVLVTLLSLSVFSQNSILEGNVNSEQGPVAFVNVQILNTEFITSTNSEGEFKLNGAFSGQLKIKVTAVGYISKTTEIEIAKGATLEIMVSLEEDKLDLNEVVVTGTRTSKRITDSPVIVSLINQKELDQVVAINLSEGLKYQPGLRVETDCQTCNYTQIRMNGLQGGYSQILINSRPIFSPLTGLYGLEQIPVNMIERIEVVRGGVSALYGSSAIGGTVNVITRTPKENNYDLTNTFQSIRGSAADNIFSANATIVNEKENAGASFFVNNRNREAFDANGDNFSELSKLKDNSFGANLFYIPAKNQKISASISSIYEYRYGGELGSPAEGPAFLAQQAEERTHNVLMGSIDYEIDFKDKKSSMSLYYGGQHTDRDHYTGVVPDDAEELSAFLASPPYGTSKVVTHQGGVQFNRILNKFLGGSALLTAGAEYIYDDVLDEIAAYNYLIDQTTTDLGGFIQHDWDITNNINLLSGVRVDKHNLVDEPIISPRLSVLYKFKENTQFRAGWGTGFRAPQAFDTDLHIAFAGGGISRISLAENLQEERSNSLTASVNYDKATQHFIAGFTIEGFYTTLDNAFFQFPLGQDEFGERFEKRNGSGAVVQGVTIEARANFDYVFQIDAGFTLQSSRFNDAVETIEGLPSRREFLRTPNDYGYATFTYTPTKKWNISTNVVYTGSMEIAHFGGEGTGQLENEYFSSPEFIDVGLRIGHTFELEKTKTGIEVFGGVKNIFDAYQTNFDISKNRDSNFIYGPSLPRTLLIGLRLKSI